MKCPYPNCRKDYNDQSWTKIMNAWVSPGDTDESYEARSFYNRLYVVTRKCRFCHQLFHEILVGHENIDKYGQASESTLEPLVSYPVAKMKLEAKTVPQNVIDAFHEAERCRSIGSLTGTGSCLRKTVYTLCDEKKAPGVDYKEKIGNLPVKDAYKELLKQIKWIGDNTTKPGEEKYTLKMVDVALEILPILIDDMYIKDEKADEVAKLLAKARSATSAASPEKK